LKECPFCPKPTYGRRDNMYTLNINPLNGIYHCFRCNDKGNWYDFKSKLNSLIYGDFVDKDSEENYIVSDNKNNGISNVIQKHSKSTSNVYNDEFKEVLEWLYSRKFNDQTIKEFNIGIDNISYNNYDNDGYETVKSIVFP